MPTLAAPAGSLVLPEQLAQQAADAVRELLAEAAAANTTRSYAAALRYWAGWHQARFGIELTLPVSEAAVIQFLVDHIQRKSKTGLVSELPPVIGQALVAAGLKANLGPLKLATVAQRVAVLSTAHKLRRLTNPCELASVRTLLSRARRAAVKRGERPTKKTAITRPELEAMLATCDDSLEALGSNTTCTDSFLYRRRLWTIVPCVVDRHVTNGFVIQNRRQIATNNLRP